MKRFFALCVICALFVPFAGCDKKTGTKTETTTTTPGGSTTTTEQSKTETSGENPPPAAK
ncbi:MAG TPA: hypothetical protein VL175_10480 [Pirellulales bacterium]|jgi:hypothetical protein|nr:hypothetical protein [Pirellulales bacterium]